VKKISLPSVFFIFAFILSISFSFDLWKKNRITLDAPSYYTYLPATFIYHDLHLKFIDKDPEYFKDKIWYYKIENGNKLIKHPMGISVALSPFFLLGHLTAKLTGAVQDGYSLTYQNFVCVGVLLYLFLGLFYLRKTLLRFFTEKITALTLICLVLGTNLLWYSTFEGLMPHAISFSLLSMSLYFFFEWLSSASKKMLLMFGLLFGLSVLIRPLAITTIIYFLIVAIMLKGNFRSFFDFLKPQFKNIILASLIAFGIISLQFFYWKYITGSWIFDVYMDEHFVFNSPQILPFLFSFRKGVFIYTPILIFAVIGLIRLFKTNRPVFYGSIVIMSITIWLLSSWWAWSYGICWGMRPMIDYYSILSIPLATGFTYLFSKKRILSSITGIFIVFFLLLNFFQTWQYKNGLIHYDDMTKEAYFKGFFQTKITREWQDLLKPYDWDRRIKGLPQVEYSKDYLEESFKTNDVYFRAFNLQYVTMNEKAQNAIAAYQKEISGNSLFRIIPVKGDTVSVMTAAGNFLSISKEYDNILLASSSIPTSADKFILVYLDPDDNRIALKTMNNKYVTVSAIFPFLLYATSNEIEQKETFRLFIKEN
jgi:hypothetical protein